MLFNYSLHFINITSPQWLVCLNPIVFPKNPNNCWPLWIVACWQTITIFLSFKHFSKIFSHFWKDHHNITNINLIAVKLKLCSLEWIQVSLRKWGCPKSMTRGQLVFVCCCCCCCKGRRVKELICFTKCFDLIPYGLSYLTFTNKILIYKAWKFDVVKSNNFFCCSFKNDLAYQNTKG